MSVLDNVGVLVMLGKKRLFFSAPEPLPVETVLLSEPL